MNEQSVSVAAASLQEVDKCRKIVKDSDKSYLGIIGFPLPVRGQDSNAYVENYINTADKNVLKQIHDTLMPKMRQGSNSPFDAAIFDAVNNKLDAIGGIGGRPKSSKKQSARRRRSSKARKSRKSRKARATRRR